jgi:hypothetical protein
MSEHSSISIGEEEVGSTVLVGTAVGDWVDTAVETGIGSVVGVAGITVGGIGVGVGVLSGLIELVSTDSVAVDSST